MRTHTGNRISTNSSSILSQVTNFLIAELEEFCPELKYLWSGKENQIIRSKDKRYESKQEMDFNELEIHMTDTQSNNFFDIK